MSKVYLVCRDTYEGNYVPSLHTVWSSAEAARVAADRICSTRKPKPYDMSGDVWIEEREVDDVTGHWKKIRTYRRPEYLDAPCTPSTKSSAPLDITTPRDRMHRLLIMGDGDMGCVTTRMLGVLVSEPTINEYLTKDFQDWRPRLDRYFTWQIKDQNTVSLQCRRCFRIYECSFNEIERASTGPAVLCLACVS